MEIVIKKEELLKFIKRNSLSENRTPYSDELSTIMSDDDDEGPILPNPQMATQLSEDIPPIEDPDYIPTNVEEVSTSCKCYSA